MVIVKKRERKGERKKEKARKGKGRGGEEKIPPPRRIIVNI